VRPTMVDVARASGVSLKTVSRVVNGELGVRPETARRVTLAIQALGYRENEIARSLRRGQRSSTVGLIIEDLANPFYSAIARAVEDVARKYGYVVIVGSSEEDPGRERELVGTFLKRRVDGLLLVPAGRDHRYLIPELMLGTAIVFLDRPPGRVDTDRILLDNTGGARLATEHLISGGHRRIGVVGDPIGIYTIRKRIEGYRRALAAAGIPFDQGLLRLTEADVAGMEAAALELLSQSEPPTALFTTNNRASVGVLRALRGQGRRIGLVGFDDFELADMLPTPVTVVRHDPAEMGRRGAELLFMRLQGDERPPLRVVLRTELVPRGSGEVAPWTA
jgi:LacI family transcriptional regulator